MSHRKPTTLHVFPPHQPQGDLRESTSARGVRRLGHGPRRATMSCIILGDSLGSSAFCVLIYTMMGWTRRSLRGFKLQNALTPRHRWTPCPHCPLWVLLSSWRRALPCQMYPVCFLKNKAKRLNPICEFRAFPDLDPTQRQERACGRIVTAFLKPTLPVVSFQVWC